MKTAPRFPLVLHQGISHSLVELPKISKIVGVAIANFLPSLHSIPRGNVCIAGIRGTVAVNVIEQQRGQMETPRVRRIRLGQALSNGFTCQVALPFCTNHFLFLQVTLIENQRSLRWCSPRQSFWQRTQTTCSGRQNRMLRTWGQSGA